MDIASWLRSLGLERYEAAFRENEIDETVLRGLTSEDLKDLGVGAVGHRRKLLDAIAARHPSAAPEAPPVEVPENAVERRRVTVIFADLVGFTALSVRMDPEDLQSVIGAYHQCVAKTIHSFDGFVASYLGDGALVYFGYPQAHEDDADRAVRASLALIDAVASLPTPEPLQVRIGVATGLVLVGDLIGSGVANKHGIIGETPNLAARLQTWSSRTPWLSAKAHESFSAVCSSCEISGQKTSRASPDRFTRGVPCEQVRWRAVSRRCAAAS